MARHKLPDCTERALLLAAVWLSEEINRRMTLAKPEDLKGISNVVSMLRKTVTVRQERAFFRKYARDYDITEKVAKRKYGHLFKANLTID